MSMLRQRRQEVHGRIAHALSGRDQEARPELVAHHLEAAGQLAAASEWLDRAADVAFKTGANKEAIRFCDELFSSWMRAENCGLGAC